MARASASRARPARRSSPIRPLPSTMPGRFFVLTYDRGTQRFSLMVDDADRSSYDLGQGIDKVLRQLIPWQMDKFLTEAIDRVVEFRTVQCIPAKGLVVRLALPDPQPDVFAKEPKNDAPTHL